MAGKPKKRRSSGASPEPRSEGQRQLLEVDATTTEIAGAIGRTQQLVSCWRRGVRVPGEAPRAKLEAVYGIPRASWGQKPGKKSAKKSPAKGKGKAPSKAATKRGDSGSKVAANLPRRSPSTLGEVEEQLDVLQSLQRDEGLLNSEKVRVSDSISKLLAIKARLERDRELLEDRIVREHPTWTRIRQAILRALEDHPEASKAVVEELRKVEGEQAS